MLVFDEFKSTVTRSIDEVFDFIGVNCNPCLLNFTSSLNTCNKWRNIERDQNSRRQTVVRGGGLISSAINKAIDHLPFETHVPG